jgi:putative phosphoesterase
MLIGLISDVHATPRPVAEALTIFANEGVQQIFCAGDIAGYREQLDDTVELLAENNCRCVLGNHDLLYLDHFSDDRDDKAVIYFSQLPSVIDTIINETSVYMVHAHPPDACHGGIKLLDRFGKLDMDQLSLWERQLGKFDHDVLIVGHTHQVFAEYIGKTLVLNPGSTAFNHSCMILRLPEMTTQVFSLSGKAVERTWNWGEYMIGGR